MRAELKALHERLGATMLYVTHDQEEAMTLGDRLVVMDGGVVQQCASPREVYERPANRFVAGFVGTPSTNFLEGTMADGRLGLPGGSSLEVGEPHQSRQGAVALGVRPDALRRASSDDQARVSARIVLVEDLGDRCDVRLEAEDGTELVARRPASELADWERLGANTLVPLTFEREDAHLFEPGPHGKRLD